MPLYLELQVYNAYLQINLCRLEHVTSVLYESKNMTGTIRVSYV
jgi:hypothetical protein